ncbi:MAG: carboxypeptidase regulatory-like domain-containing protein [Candidatus Hydrogenedentes bacterium]|nr:carboxypeptidase regulatory-like domain-containing protein [Candidatus Hydrogenedentota bacterium]
MTRRRRTSSLSALQVIGILVALLMAIIVAILALMEEKPLPPPVSRLSYESPPVARRPDYEPLEAAVDAPRARIREAVEVPRAEKTGEEATWEYKIQGSVQTKDTKRPLKDAWVSLRRLPEAAEKQAHQDALDAAATEKEQKRWNELKDEEYYLMYEKGVNTGADGRYAIPVPRPGKYEVHVRRQGNIRANAEAVLSESKRTVTLDFELGTGASVAGRVVETGTATGAPGLEVMAEQTEGQGYRSVHSNIKTGADGTYMLGGLIPGTYDISVRLSDTAFQVGKELPFKKVTITREDEKVTGIDFSVDAAGVVWGYVTTPEGEPVRAEVILVTSESIMSQALNAALKMHPPLSTHSEKDGYYELLGVPLSETWRLHTMNKTNSPQLSDAFVLSPAQRTARMDIFMFSGSDILGQVVNTRNEPVPDAEVYCLPSVGALVSPLDSPQSFKEERADENGYFILEDLPAGTFQVIAQKEGYKFSTRGEPVYPDGYTPIKNMLITLDDVDRGEYTIFGTVSTTAGQPISGASVELGGMGMESMQGTDHSTTTDSSGYFQFDGIEQGFYAMEVSADGYASRQITRVLLDEATDVTLSSSALLAGTVTVKETGQPPVYATVHATLTGASGSEGMFSFLEQVGGGGISSGVENGQFSMTVAPGEYVLEARADGLTPVRQTVAIAEGEQRTDLKLFVSKGGGRIAGRVQMKERISPQGAAVYLLEGASELLSAVQLAAMDGNADKVRRVGEDGEFVFEQLAAGVYTVAAQHPSFPPVTESNLVVEENGNRDGIVLLIGGGGSLEGYVYANGQAVAGKTVVVLANGQPFPTTTDEHGYYRITDLPEGTHPVLLTDADPTNFVGLLNTESRPVSIEAGRTTRYDFGDGSGITLYGLCDPANSSFMGGFAELRAPGLTRVPIGGSLSLTSFSGFGGDTNYSVSISNGQFKFENITPGRWQLDIYYPEGFLELKLVHSEVIELLPDAPEVERVFPLIYFQQGGTTSPQEAPATP